MRAQSSTMPVISVRLNPEDFEFLRKNKLKPGPFLKEAGERRLRYLRRQEALAWMVKHAMKSKPGDRPAVELIREDRDRGH